MKPKVCVLVTDGTNCDKETAYAFRKAGGNSELVHINQLRNRQRNFRDYQILVISGGFSHGDVVASGKILAVELIFLQDELEAFVEKGKLIMGICNGFQVLTQTGLLPLNTMNVRYATLMQNESGKFECRWVKLLAEKNSPCIFTQGYDEEFTLQVANGEGNFFIEDKWPEVKENGGCVALRYSSDEYPENPSGSLYAIAGICDPSGRIFGLMPHPERFVEGTQYVNWRREKIAKPNGLLMFENAVRFAKDL